MIELFAPKQIRCEHCGFEFMMTGFSSAAKIVCLACGEETTLPPPRFSERKAEFPEIVSKSATESLLCSVEQCPLLNEGEANGNPAKKAVGEQVKQRLHKKARRRRNILAWTVMLQVCVLIGVATFVVKPLIIPERSQETTQIANAEVTEDTVEPVIKVPPPEQIISPPSPITRLPEPIAPIPAVPEVQTAQDNVQENELFAGVVKPEVDVASLEPVQGIMPPLAFGDTVPGSLAGDAVPALPTPLPPAEPFTRATADRLLESAKTLLMTDPEGSAQQAARAAKIYEELDEEFPDALYWVMGNAFASLSWGEPLLESSPAIESMTLSADNRFLLAQLRDKTVWLWDLYSPDEERQAYRLDHGTAEYVKFVFSPDLRWIIGGQKGGAVRIWDMSLERPGDKPIMFVDRVPDLQDLQISPNGQWLAAFGNSPQSVQIGASDSPQYSVKLWNLRQLETGIVPTATPMPPVLQPIQNIRFNPNSNRLAFSSKDRVVRIYDLTAQGVGEEPFVLRGHQLDVTQIAFAPCGQWVATGSQDNTIRLWSLMGSRLSPEAVTLFGHIGWISTLTIDKTGEYILSGSYDRTIRIWNVTRNRGTLNAPPVVLKTNLGVPESLAITKDGDKMVVLGSEGSLGIYHLPSLLADDTDDYRAVTFRNSRLSISKSVLTTDDQLLIFSYEHLSNPLNNGIRLWALQTQSFVR